jgi:hypothetical protein
MKICGSQNQNENAILQGAGRHDTFFLNAGVFWLTEQTYHTWSNSSVRTTCPLSPKTPGAFADQLPLR